MEAWFFGGETVLDNDSHLRAHENCLLKLFNSDKAYYFEQYPDLGHTFLRSVRLLEAGHIDAWVFKPDG